MSLEPGAYRPETNPRIGTSIEANEPINAYSDDWYRSYDQKTRMSAAIGSEQLRDACQRSGQTIAPRAETPRLTFEEQLALVASGRARIVDLDRA